jgi:hypothetical protein
LRFQPDGETEKGDEVMKIHQLSLFLENEPGHLGLACRELAKAGISIQTLSLADTQQFGILRLVVREWEKAKEILEKAGCVVNVAEVVAVEVEDRPGGLAEILDVIEECGLNIEYMYAFTFGRGDRAVLVFRFADVDLAVEKFQGKNVNLVSSVEIFDREG